MQSTISAHSGRLTGRNPFLFCRRWNCSRVLPLWHLIPRTPAWAGNSWARTGDDSSHSVTTKTESPQLGQTPDGSRELVGGIDTDPRLHLGVLRRFSAAMWRKGTWPWEMSRGRPALPQRFRFPACLRNSMARAARQSAAPYGNGSRSSTCTMRERGRRIFMPRPSCSFRALELDRSTTRSS